MQNPAEVVGKFKEAVKNGNLIAARTFLHDELRFRGPLETHDAPEPYLQAIAKLGHIVDRVDMHKMFVDGADVCMLYDMVTKTQAGTAFIAEWLRVEKGKITMIRVVFDARPFAQMFGK